MKRLIAIFTVTLALSGCAVMDSVVGMVPSFWDDNQSSKITDVRLLIKHIQCDQPQAAQAQQIDRELAWFELYSQSKGQRQADVLRIIKPMQETVGDWRKRAAGAEPSKAYCEAKKKILDTQSARAASSILGRF